MPCIWRAAARFLVFAGGLLAAAPAARAEGAPYARWAILSSPSLQRSGFSDLVANQLQQQGVNLVERDQINALLHEQSLVTALAAEGSAQRAQLGRVVKADALLLMQDEIRGTDPRIRIVLAECRQGARLSVNSYSQSGPAEDTARKIGARLADVRNQFSGGLKGVIGVPPFICRSFTYEYHPLQTGYAALLQEAFRAVPGIAVIELEEARAIRHESELAGGKTEGAAPLFVEGEFEVLKTTPRTANFKITVRSADKLRTIEKRSLTLDQAWAFVSHELPGDVLPDAHPIQRLQFTADQEFQALVARADSFASLGEWEHSVSLREAALVLRPDSDEQRTKLSTECISLVEALAPLEVRRAAGMAWESLAAKGLVWWASALESLDWQLHRNDDPHGNRIRQASRALIAVNCFNTTGVGEEAQRAKREFILHAGELLNHPNWPGDSEGLAATLRAKWAQHLIESACRHYFDPLKSDDYDLLLTLLKEVVPEDTDPPRALTDLLFDDPKMIQRGPEFLDFVKQLGQSRRSSNRILSRGSMLAWNVRLKHACDDAELKEIDALRRETRAPQLSSGNLTAATTHTLDSLRLEIVALQNAQHLAATRRTVGPPFPALVETGLLRLENIPLLYKAPNGTVTPSQTFTNGAVPGLGQLLRCSDSLTLAWDEFHVALMREPGVFEEILSASPNQGPSFTDAQWDGKHIWLATLRDGLWQVDTSGKVLAKLGEAEGLPPCDRGARLVVLGPDRLMIAGAFGSTHRAFLALVGKDQAGYHVRVFHKAPRVIEDQRSPSDAADADLAFIPQEMALCRSRDGSGLFVLLRRQGATRGADSHPLIVDCTTLDVAVPVTPTGLHPFLACAGGILQVSDLQDQITLLHPSPDGRALVPDFAPLHLPRAGTPNSWAGASSNGWALGSDGQIYLMGNVWFRIEPSTMTACRLTPAGSPAGPMRAGNLTHFGFVALGQVRVNSMSMFKISVNEEQFKSLPPQDCFAPGP